MSHTTNPRSDRFLGSALSALSGRPAITPQRWQPQPIPARARRNSGTHRMGALHLLRLPGHGPEDVLVDAEGHAYTGLDDGRIVRVDLDGRCHTLASTGGRPLGLAWHPDGRLLVCEPFRGLLAVDLATAAVEVLADRVDGVPMRFCSNATAAPDGTIYFTDSSQRFGFDDNMAAVLEHSRTGRLLRLAPGGAPEVLLDGLAFANGLTTTADGSALVVVETFEYRLTRYWLDGPKAGTADVFADNLPGIPDNMSTGSDGLLWVALSTPRNAALDRLLPRAGVFRQLAFALPDRLQPKPARTVWVVAFDDHGQLRYDLQTDGDDYALVTGVCEHNGRVFVSSLDEPALAWFELAAAT